jgi:Flp pilus assembly protein CpaB
VSVRKTSGGTRKRRPGLPFVIIGAVLGLLAAGAAIIYVQSAGSGTSTGTIPVVVAARDIGIRVQILPADVTVAQFHESDVPPGSFAKVTDLKSVVAAVNITKGQPVTNNLLLGVGGTVIGPQSAFLPIPTGYVALTIPTGEQQGVGGYIQVGDYLSMVVQLNGKTGKNVRTVYTNVPVIRVGAAPADTTPVQGGTTIPPKQGGLSNSLTIIVTQCQAEFISWFLGNGILTYTLESYHDYRPQDIAADPACPGVASAKGVTQADVGARWPGILT